MTCKEILLPYGTRDQTKYWKWVATFLRHKQGEQSTALPGLRRWTTAQCLKKNSCSVQPMRLYVTSLIYLGKKNAHTVNLYFAVACMHPPHHQQACLNATLNEVECQHYGFFCLTSCLPGFCHATPLQTYKLIVLGHLPWEVWGHNYGFQSSKSHTVDLFSVYLRKFNLKVFVEASWYDYMRWTVYTLIKEITGELNLNTQTI